MYVYALCVLLSALPLPNLSSALSLSLSQSRLQQELSVLLSHGSSARSLLLLHETGLLALMLPLTAAQLRFGGKASRQADSSDAQVTTDDAVPKSPRAAYAMYSLQVGA